MVTNKVTNEYPKIQLLQEGGLKHQPLYLCHTLYKGNEYYGIGYSVKKAKANLLEDLEDSISTEYIESIPSEYNFLFTDEDTTEYEQETTVNDQEATANDKDIFESEKNTTESEKNTIQSGKNITESDNVTIENKHEASVSYDGTPSPQPLKRLKHGISLNTSAKSPISLLNELKPAAVFSVEGQVGPPHSPIFQVSVKLNDEKFTATGRSKKNAKARAAELALQSFIQLPTNISRVSVSSDADFSKDSFTNSSKNIKPNSITNVSVAKGSLMVLNELYPGSKFEYVEYENDQYARFKAIVTIGNEKFEGSGCRKQLAKNAAAAAALAHLVPDFVEQSPLLPYKNQIVNSETQTLADHVGRLVMDKFLELMKNDSVHAKRKVLAGIVMTKGNDLQTSEVIAVTTGTKCISGECISINGAALNDLHAEIVARRCLRVYFFEQLQLAYIPGQHESSIFEQQPNEKCKLKNGIAFHLFINTAPCGDARIFSPTENNDVDQHPHRISRGQLRTKIESGEGTIPVSKQNSIQTWDGVLQGERLLTMSCSDKIARWNVLGLQGSLLSNFMEPVYLTTIVLGSLLNEAHLYRAICGRIENTLEGLQPPYLLNRPVMLLTTSSERRVAVKAPSFSVNWKINNQNVEIINTTNGKPEEGISKLCKQSMMKHFVELRKKCGFKGDDTLSYREAKALSTEYNAVKRHLFEAFVNANLGSWIKKPFEQDEFQLAN